MVLNRLKLIMDLCLSQLLKKEEYSFSLLVHPYLFMETVMNSLFSFVSWVSFLDSTDRSSLQSSFFFNARVNLDGSLEEGMDITSIFSNRVMDIIRLIHVVIIYSDYWVGIS